MVKYILALLLIPGFAFGQAFTLRDFPWAGQFGAVTVNTNAGVKEQNINVNGNAVTQWRYEIWEWYPESSYTLQSIKLLMAKHPSNAAASFRYHLTTWPPTNGQQILASTDYVLSSAIANTSGYGGDVGNVMNLAFTNPYVVSAGSIYGIAIEASQTANNFLHPHGGPLNATNAPSISYSNTMTGWVGSGLANIKLWYISEGDNYTPASPNPYNLSNSIANMYVWCKAGIGACTDTACTTAATDGQLVAGWKNISTNTAISNFIQSTSGIRPTYFTNGTNGKPKLGFSTNRLDMATFGPYAVPYTIFMVGKLGTAPADYNPWMWSPAADVQITTPKSFSNDGIYITSGTTLNPTLRWTNIVGSIDALFGASGQVFINSGVSVEGTSGITSLNGMNLGMYSGGAAFGNNLVGDIYEFIFIKGTPSTTERGMIEAYFRAEYNLP